ncbi:hypothetical protein A3726_34810 [Erythrobacter sp. HI0037]|nr:hypothetical protein A3726_34810 [Erythrobacter sp. HI0037]
MDELQVRRREWYPCVHCHAPFAHLGRLSLRNQSGIIRNAFGDPPDDIRTLRFAVESVMFDGKTSTVFVALGDGEHRDAADR